MVRVSTREIILSVRPETPNERGPLQAAGEALDRETEGKWVADVLAQRSQDLPDEANVVVDAVRIEAQIDQLRQVFGQKVIHIHLTASLQELERRYLSRPPEMREFATYAKVRASPTEASIENLAHVADVVVDTERSDPDDVMIRAVAQLGLFPRAIVPLVDVLVGAQYGSEGKGNIAAYLAREYDVLVRVGGPNAGHKVAYPKYTFVHLPAGTSRNPNARLIIGPGAVIDLEVLMKEIQDCHVDAERLSIDPQAMIIEESDKAWEEQNLNQMGSTKQGVGAATARKILGREEQAVLGAKVRLVRDIEALAPYRRHTAEALDRAYAAGHRILLEGTQGTSLSIHHGFWPKVTSRETTTAGCLADAGIAPLRVRRVIMVTRTYPIRVGGDSGYMKREISTKIVSERSGLPLDDIDKTERASRTGRSRRISEFDWAQVRRAAMLNGATDIALTFSDYIRKENQQARRYEQLTRETIMFIEELERITGVPVSLISTRFELRNIIDRRAW